MANNAGAAPGGGAKKRVTQTILCVAALLAACEHDPGESLDARGWSMGELHLLTRAFVQNCVDDRTWVDAFVAAAGRKPVVRVRGLTNQTGEDIDTRQIAWAVERALAGLEQVRVAPASEAADFMLQGSIKVTIASSVVDGAGQTLRRYSDQLSLVTLPAGHVVCTGGGAVSRQDDV